MVILFLLAVLIFAGGLLAKSGFAILMGIAAIALVVGRWLALSSENSSAGDDEELSFCTPRSPGVGYGGEGDDLHDRFWRGSDSTQSAELFSSDL